MAFQFPEAAGAYSQRRDKSGFVSSTGALVAGIIGYSLKGSLKPTTLTTVDQLDRLFGRPDPKVSYAHYGMRKIINAGFPVIFQRVVNGARYGGAAVLSEAAINSVSSAKYPTTGSAFTADADPTTGIAPTGPNYISLTFDGPLVTANVVNLNIIFDSTVVAVGPVNFVTNNDATMIALAAAIEAALATGGSDGKATVIDTDPASVTNARTIGIFAPSGQSIALSGIAVTAGATQATASLSYPLFFVQAEGPGADSKNIGYKLTNADIGSREVIKMTFATLVGSVSSLTVNVNGVDCALVSNIVPSDAFLQAVAVAIAAHADVDTAVVTKKSLGESNDREIIITMLRGSATDAIITHVATGAAPAITYTQLVKGVTPSGAFDLEIYTAENPTVPSESHRVNLALKTDASGVQQKIDYVVNKGATASELVRIIPNAADDGTVVIPFNPATGAIMTSVSWLSAGTAGALPTAGGLAAAWSVFEDTQKYPVNVLVNCGYTAVAVQQAMVAVAAKRYDGTQAILDIPPEYQKYDSLVSYRLTQMAVDSEFAAAYFPDIKQEDVYTGMSIWVPPSAAVAVAYGRNDQTRGVGKAPAGMTRGQIDTSAVRFDYDVTQEGHLFNRLKLNIIKREGAGYVIWGDTTTQMRDSAFSFVSISRLVGYLEGRIRNFAKSAVFEGNTDTEVFSLVQGIDRFLRPYKPDDLADYLIVSNSENTPNGIIEQGNRIVDTILDPVRTMRRILVRTTVTQTGGIASIEVSEID